MNVDEEPMEEPVDDSIPIYEPLYPELEQICSHPNCEQASPPGERLCDDCTVVMDDDTPGICEFCGDFLRRTPEDADQNA